MDYRAASKSDIDFDFDDSSGSSDVSIATDASSMPDYEVADQFEQSMALNDADTDDEVIYEKRLRGDSEDSDDFGPAIVVPLKTGSDHGDGSGESEPIDTGSPGSLGSRRIRSGSFNRRPPTRTKSGEGMTTSSNGAVSGSRRPPTRTKSGGGIPSETDEDGESNLRRRPPRRTKSGSGHAIRRRPPQRTKSGGTLHPKSPNGNGGDGESEDVVADLPDDETNPEDGDEYREKALSRNMARRQRSTDLLGAMREATRNVPSRSRSDVSGITNGRRRVAGRTRSSDGGLPATDDPIEELGTPGRKPLRRKAPPRTKSGGRLAAPPPLET